MMQMQSLHTCKERPASFPAVEDETLCLTRFLPDLTHMWLFIVHPRLGRLASSRIHENMDHGINQIASICQHVRLFR